MILIILIGLDQDYQEIQPNRETRGVAFHLARENPDKPDMRSHEAHRLLFPPFFLFVSVIAQNPSGLSGLATARSYLSSQTPELMVSISTVSTKPFGFGGKPHKPRPTVENTPRIGVGDLQGVGRAAAHGLRARGDGPCRHQRQARGDRRRVRCPQLWRRRAAVLPVPDVLAEGPAFVLPGRAPGVQALRRPDLQEPAHAPSWSAPCARFTPQARCV